MTGTLIRKDTALAWELRLRAYDGAEVVLSLDGAPSVRGYVSSVAPSGAYVELETAREEEPLLVPVSQIANVRRPHFHEDGAAPRRRRVADPDPFPGQLRLGDPPPPVRRRSRRAMDRAAAMLLPAEYLSVLAALDAAAHRRSAVSTADVAEALGRTPQWTVRRLARLAEMHLVETYRERGRYSWRPGG